MAIDVHEQQGTTGAEQEGAEHYDVVVIGAGPAGVSAAVRAAQLGASVAVAEANRVGGTCVNSGCVPTRVLARAARLLRDVRTAGDFGVDVPRPALAWERTVARVHEVVEQVQDSKDIRGHLDAAGVRLFTEGPARFTDPHTVQLAGSRRRLHADSFVVATGGRSRRLPLPGIELTTVPERIVDLEQLPRSVAIVGSGNTGVQLVTVFSAFGARVTLLELADRVLPASDHDVSAALERAFRGNGVALRTGLAGVTRVEARDGGLKRVVFTAYEGGEEEHVDVEAVVVCAGWPANLEGLGLDAAGVATARSAVTADRHQRTSAEHIWVAGDADGDAALVQAGVVDGFVAATNAVLGDRRGALAVTDHTILPSGGFTDPDYGQVGLTEAQAREAHPDALVVTVPYRRVERAVIDARTAGFLKLVATPDARRLLGAHAVGEEALEVIQAVAAAMAAGADVRALATTEYAYPTYTSIIGLAAEELLRAGGHDESLPEAAASVGASEVDGVGGTAA
jgi:glutathione reductase (NADPH)